MTKVHGALGIHLFLFLAILAPLAGCTGGSSEYSDDEIQAKIKEFDYEKGVRGFEPPTLEELNANNKWTDKPVIDLLDKLKQDLANYQPPMPPAEAVNLKSENDEQIKEILESVKVLPKSEDEVDWDATWVHHVAGDINSLNPLTMSSTSDFDVAALTGVGAITSDINLNPIGNGTFIKSWQVNEDNTVHKFVIRDDLTWSDGEPITAYDWEFTFKLVKHPDMVAYMPAISSGMETVLYLKAYDDHTFCIFHEKSTAVNEWKNEFPVVPKHIYYESIAMDPSMVDSDIHMQLEEKPVVGGPYEVVSRTRQKNVILQRRDGFYMHDGKQVRDKPYFKQIRMEVITDTNTALLALSSGKIDEMEIPAPKWNTDANTPEFFAKNVKVKATEWTEYHITWNCESEFFKDPKVRTAMSYGIDYKELLDRVLDGLFEQANGPFHPTSWMSPEPPLPMFTYDLEKARKLLDEAGWVDSDADGIRDKMIGDKKVPFTFTLMRGQTPTSEKVARVVVTSLNKLGIKVEERATEFTVLQQKAQDHTFDALLGGWGSGTDPFYTKNIFGTGQTRNYGQYSNAKIDALYEEGMVELDHEKRAKIYQEMATIFYEDQPYTWLFYLSSLYGFNKDMRGYEFSARGPFHYSPGMESVWKVKPLQPGLPPDRVRTVRFNNLTKSFSRMLTYIARRILIGIFTLLAVTFIVYGLIRNMPGTPLTIMQETVRMDAMMSQEQMDKLEKQYRLDKPWYTGYWYWLGDVLQGDLGRGINDRRKVTIIIGERLPKTLMLTGTSLLLTYLLCIPMGLWSTANALSFRERLVSTVLYILYALPSFVAAVYLNLVIAVRLEWLPLYGSTGEGYAEMSSMGKAWDIASHAILPVVCLTYTSLAYYTRFIKANMMETIQQDYIRTAKAKGASPTTILVTHAFRNSLIPLVTIIGLTLPSLLAGSVILETIYQWNGIGYLFYQSITQREYPVIMGLVLMFSVMTLLGQLLADVLYAFVDPRITYS